MLTKNGEDNINFSFVYINSVLYIGLFSMVIYFIESTFLHNREEVIFICIILFSETLRQYYNYQLYRIFIQMGLFIKKIHKKIFTEQRNVFFSFKETLFLCVCFSFWIKGIIVVSEKLTQITILIFYLDTSYFFNIFTFFSLTIFLTSFLIDIPIH